MSNDYDNYTESELKHAYGMQDYYNAHGQVRDVEIIYNEEKFEDDGMAYEVLRIGYDMVDINFEIKFTNDKKSNVCNIDIFNLSESTIKRIKSGSKIRIKAGYDSFNGYIFTGNVDYSYIQKNGDDLVVKIICTPNAKSWNTEFISESWARGALAEDIVYNIIEMAGWKIGEIDINRLSYNGGKTFRKQAKLCLQEIANDTNSTLYFNNGIVYMYKKDKIVKKKITISPKTGLYDFPTKNIKQKTKEETYTIKTALRYDYTEDTIIVVRDSKFIEPVELKIINGIHKATDNEFYTELECKKITNIKSELDEDTQDLIDYVNE